MNIEMKDGKASLELPLLYLALLPGSLKKAQPLDFGCNYSALCIRHSLLIILCALSNDIHSKNVLKDVCIFVTGD